ncbi:gamma-glutamylcyclotransferase family protein [Legionella oakridgensis]|uniref:AIG2-like family n=2 Tax=Legionella oakridgensis TaxID=29423 RepID=W0BES8_9GAMM|nr:gamma-glutamylcyclotransferase family protein [Legionella oakridgensis]AHE67137.1 AIG2-like family [Legionella oakridgensis ATCC 33761 = DSM 21215]ETO93234.1 AIG2-like family [Legionella oakridgensis RV-2-2007]KTD38055.1 AIG2-like family protein [Legionella oakridgensis]STY20222.1 AIG2-like family [Legionella longbeachae]
MNHTEKLFSYGTLQYETVQFANFGRKLVGQVDRLSGFKLSSVEITDANMIAASEEKVYPIVSYTGLLSDEVCGMVFDISLNELEQADAYEGKDYKRIQVQLASGVKAWVYVDARQEGSINA